MAAVYNDGTIPYGSRVLTIGAVGFIADDVEITRPTQIIPRTNQLNEPTGWIATPDFVEGSANLQIPTAGSIPALGATFDTDFGGGSETWVVTELGIPEAKDQDKKVRISFRKTYN